MLWQMAVGAVAAILLAPPVPAPAVAPVTGDVLRPFERPATPYGPGHRGVDLGAGSGEVVRAAMGGVVRFAGPVAGVVWVTIAHGGGLETTYGGLTPTVRAGERVSIGQPIGHVTRSARLDWGARRDGEYVDPMGLLGGWEVRLVPLHDPPLRR